MPTFELTAEQALNLYEALGAAQKTLALRPDVRDEWALTEDDLGHLIEVLQSQASEIDIVAEQLGRRARRVDLRREGEDARAAARALNATRDRSGGREVGAR